MDIACKRIEKARWQGALKARVRQGVGVSLCFWFVVRQKPKTKADHAPPFEYRMMSVIISKPNGTFRTRQCRNSPARLISLIGFLCLAALLAFAAFGPSNAASDPDSEPPQEEGELRRLRGHDGRITRVAATADGRRFVSGSRDGMIRVWDFDRGVTLHAFGSRPGAMLIVESATITGSGQRIATGYHDKTIRIWDAKTATELRQLADEGIPFLLAFSSDGRRMLAGGGKAPVRLWDVEASKIIGRPRVGRTVYSLGLTPDGLQALVGMEGGELILYDAEAGTVQGRFVGHRTDILGLAISADGQRALTSDFVGEMILWDLKEKRRLKRFEHERHQPIQSVAISADGRMGLSGSDDATLRLWDLESGNELHRITFDSIVWSVAMSADARRAASGTSHYQVRLWDLSRWLPAGRP